MTSFFDVQKQLGYYGAYHHNPINQYIHIVFVPVILWTAFVFGALIGGPPLVCGGVIVYMVYYIILQPFAGSLYAPILLALGYTALQFARTHENALAIALGIHIFSWIIQFIGHGVFEKRSPALTDSALDAFLLAPLFTWLEVLFKLGWNPELHKRLNAAAALEIAAYKKSKQN